MHVPWLRNLYAPACLSSGVLLLSVFALNFGFGQFGSGVPGPGPNGMEDLEEFASAQGLHLHRVKLTLPGQGPAVLSEQPLDDGQINSLRFSDLSHPCWIGRVFACPRTSTRRTGLPLPGAVWGNVLLFGDPEMIGRLTAQER